MDLFDDSEPILGQVVDRDTYYDKEVWYGGEQEVNLHEAIWKKVTLEFERAGKSAEPEGENDDSHLILEDGDSLTFMSVGPEMSLKDYSVTVRNIRVYVDGPNYQGAVFLTIPFDEEGNVTQFPRTSEYKRMIYSGSQPCRIVGPDLQVQLFRDRDVARILPAKEWEGPEVNHTSEMSELTVSATVESIVLGVLDHAKGSTCHAESDFMKQPETTLMRTALHEIYEQAEAVLIDPETRKVAILTIPTRQQSRALSLSSGQLLAKPMDYLAALIKTREHWENIWHPKTLREFKELSERIRAFKKGAVEP